MEENVNEIFLELAGELRLGMLIRLNDKKTRLSELAREFDVTPQEAHRNIDRLISIGLVAKDHESQLSLTGFGKAVISQISGFKFLIKNSQYFKEHALGDLPLSLVHRMGELYNGQVINGVVRVFDKWKEIVDNAKEYINATKATVSLEMIMKMAEAAGSGVKYSYVLAEDAIVPKGRSELHRKLGWHNLIADGFIKRKMADRVQVVVFLNERQASVLFPDLKGKADLNSMFYSEDPVFHQWCLDYFSYKWSNSDMFDDSKLKEVEDYGAEKSKST